MCRHCDTPQPKTRQDTTGSTGHTGHGEAIAKGFVSMEQLGLLCPLCSCEFIILCTTKLSRNTKNKVTKQCLFWCVPSPFSRSTKPYVALIGDLMRLWVCFYEKKPVTMFRRCHLHLSNSFTSQYVSLTSRRICHILTACQKILRDQKKTEFAVVFQYFAEDFAISEYFKIVLIMMVKKNLMLRSTTPLLSSSCAW